MLGSAGIEYADQESRLLMEYVCQADLGFYLLHADEKMPEDPTERFFSLVEERCRRVPLQHLTGEQSFLGLPIRVNAQVLIPRQDTEILAEEAIRTVREADHPLRVLDLGTGSGCLAIAIKSFCPESEVSGSDICSQALKTAADNAAANSVEIRWILSDLFSAVEGQFDLIVSNPPYIPSGVIDTLMPEVRDHEPRLALDGGPDGLAFYRQIIDACGFHSQSGCSYSEPDRSFLCPGGSLLLEIGADQAEAVTALLKEQGFEDIRVIRDLAGEDRVVTGRLVRLCKEE